MQSFRPAQTRPASCALDVDGCGQNPRRRAGPTLPTACSGFAHSLFIPDLSPFQYLLEDEVVAIEPSVLLAQAGDGAAGVQHRGVVAVAERFADLGQAHLG